MKYATDWEEIGLSNDFIFGKVMSDPELCKELLERILPGIEIDHIEDRSYRVSGAAETDQGRYRRTECASGCLCKRRKEYGI